MREGWLIRSLDKYPGTQVHRPHQTRKNMKKFSSLLTGLAALGLASQAAAQINVSFQPTPEIINAGDPASLDLVISGLGNLSSPSLGAFDFDLSYNAAVLSAVSLSFGSFLDLGILGSIQFSDLSTPGLIHLDEISLETFGDLNDAQPDSFTLATLGFDSLAPGISTIDFVFASLADETGTSITAFTTTSGLIDILGPPPPPGVPDAGSTMPLLLFGIMSLATFVNRSHMQSS
jgi:hypothetical protein